VVNGDRRTAVFSVPARTGFAWMPAAGTERDIRRRIEHGGWLIDGRSVVYLIEQPLAGLVREAGDERD
jgi:hypothetical protein